MRAVIAIVRRAPHPRGDSWLTLMQGSDERHVCTVVVPETSEPDTGRIDLDVPVIDPPGWERYALDPHAAIDGELMAGDFNAGASTSGQIAA